MQVQTTTFAATTLIPPFGGRLVDLLVPEEERAEARAYASTLPSLQMSPRVVCDLELLASGGFSPLDRFMGEADFRGVLHEMRLADGTLFPIPVTLPVAADAGLQVGTDIALRDSMNDLLAIMTIDELYPGIRPIWRNGCWALTIPNTRWSTRWPAGADSTRLAPSECFSSRGTMTFRICAAHRPRRGRCWRRPVARTWWRSRRATHCTACTRS